LVYILVKNHESADKYVGSQLIIFCIPIHFIQIVLRLSDTETMRPFFFIEKMIFLSHTQFVISTKWSNFRCKLHCRTRNVFNIDLVYSMTRTRLTIRNHIVPFVYVIFFSYRTFNKRSWLGMVHLHNNPRTIWIRKWKNTMLLINSFCRELVFGRISKKHWEYWYHVLYQCCTLLQSQLR